MSPAAPAKKKKRPRNRYDALIERVFLKGYTDGATTVEFERDELKRTADALRIELPDNLGDVIYSYRFRKALPKLILETQRDGLEWIIQLAGRSKYRFRLAKANRIVPNPSLATIKIPDNTPEIINKYPLDDEQALLAKVRYNRLIDIFLGFTTYSLQNHLRTTVRELGQIEIDELYVAIDKYGCHYVLPVQAKGGSDQISIVQTEQDIKWCQQKFPTLKCKAISAQFVSTNQIALFELRIEDHELLELKIVEERHYQLVPATELDDIELSNYRS